jgi:four helix bundle protein
MDSGLGYRLFIFAVRVIKYCRLLPKSKEYDVIKNQLIKSSTSSGANYEEAQGASSKADFFNKINISMKEMRETNYWLRILIEIKHLDEELNYLLKESLELKNILGSISSKSIKRNF